MATVGQGTYNALTAPARSAQVVAASSAQTFAPETIGVISHAAGVLTVRLADDGADSAITVAAGGFYPLRLISCPGTNAVAFTALFAEG